MRTMMKISLLVIASTFLQSCIFEYPNCPDDPWKHLKVRFDTSLCPDASPEGMALLFYPSDGSEPWRFDLRGVEGGTVSLPPDTYRVIAYNNDTYRTMVEKSDDFRLCSFTTPPAGVFDGAETLTRTPVPGIPPEGEEDVRKMPQMMWCGVVSDIDTSADSVVSVPLRQSVARISVDIAGVVNIGNINRLAAVITGMSGSYLCSGLTPSGSPTAIPFSINRPSAHSDSLSGQLLSFGKDNLTPPSYLLLYVWLSDGQNYYFKFDVTESIRNAPDPLDIHLRLGPITIPPLSGSGSGDGGLDVGVDDWDFIIIDMES